MAKNVRISDELYAWAQLEAKLQDRSIAQQLEHWAKRGVAASMGAGLTEVRVTALDGAAAMTRKLDALDVLSGKRDADVLHFISRSMARQSKPVYPGTYLKS
jgi:hypothetical protein